jgi:hypothetical protein
MFFKNVIFWLKMSYFGLKSQIFLGMVSGESNTLGSRAAKKVWRAACGPRTALWPCLLYMQT